MADNVVPVVENGMFNNPIIAIIALFVALALLRGDFLGGGNSNMNQVTNDFLYTNIAGRLDQVTSQNFQLDKDILQAQNGTQLALCQGFSGVNQSIAQIGYNMDSCCCSINRNIDALRNDVCKQTYELTTAIRMENEATRALFVQNTIQNLRDRLEEKDRQLLAANIISQTKPTTTTTA